MYYVHFINSRYPSWKLNRQSTFCGHMLMLHLFQMSCFGLNEGQVSLASRELSLKRNETKFSDSKYFHFHYNMQCSEAGHLFKNLH